MLFTRSVHNPILTAGDRWWESRAVFNPAAVRHDGRVALVYRAVGADGLSRLGVAWSEDGERIAERVPVPLYEGALDDPWARLGVEDARAVEIDDRIYLTYCKASVETAEHEPLSWEPAPFRVRSAVGESADLQTMHEIGMVLADQNSKDMVLFPERINGRFAALIRIYPSMQIIYSPDLRTWTEPVDVLEPIEGSWEQERVGAGPPPLRTAWGWLVLYHGNEHLIMPGNKRLYRMGLAVLDLKDPTQVVYRHPEPVFSPEAGYELSGPVGNVVFGTGLVEVGEQLFLYYGAGDGVIGVAMAEREAVYSLIRAHGS